MADPNMLLKDDTGEAGSPVSLPDRKGVRDQARRHNEGARDGTGLQGQARGSLPSTTPAPCPYSPTVPDSAFSP